jgi:hypothetical protein
MDNFFAAQQAIVDRITARVPSFRIVSPRADLEQIEEAEQTTPAAYVVYAGYAVIEATSDGSMVTIEQRWTVVTACRNAATQRTGQAVREEAGPFMMDVLNALSGWQITPEHTPLLLTDAPQGGEPGYSKVFGYYPLQFKTQFTLTITPTP